ncbi:Uncharacterised protein [Kingella potus]|uniref:Uncharacterized protein n=1 Tax=Kingella potus TaxID=265175 RepID=A0A377QY86_9NEIS|nr:hypothetical protein [Kingella potus]STR00193.1 Uncharacterised protein [Kingella potus]
MSMNPVYLWYPAHFPDPAAMLPESLSAAQRIADEWAEKPLPAGADPSPFAELAAIIAKAARSKEASAGFRQSYAGIETDLPAYLRGHALAELSEHYDEIMPLLDDYAPNLGLVLYDSNGRLLLPDGRSFPEEDFFAAIQRELEEKAAAERKWRAANRGLPENIKDFYKYFRPKTDELMGRYGFEYAPQFYRPEGHDKRSRKPEPDVMVYAKPTEHGWQIVYVSIWDTYNDGVYNISVYWDLSDETAEQIYWYELDNIHPYDKKNNIKQLAAGGGVNLGYYLSDSWRSCYAGISQFKIESDVETFLAYLDKKLAEVAPIYTYADVDRFFENNTVTDLEHEAGNGLFTYNFFLERLVILYLDGKPNLREIVESWLAVDDAYIVNREFVRERYMKALNYLENRPRT